MSDENEEIPVWLSPDILKDKAIWEMKDVEWRSKFGAAMNGEKNEFSKYVKRQKTKPRTKQKP